MAQFIQVLQTNSGYPIIFEYDVTQSNSTEGDTYDPLDHQIIDKGVQTILYRYYFEDHLTDENYDEKTKQCAIPEDVTKTFVSHYPDIKDLFFTPLNGKYSDVAKKFGYVDTDYSE